MLVDQGFPGLSVSYSSCTSNQGRSTMTRCAIAMIAECNQPSYQPRFNHVSSNKFISYLIWRMQRLADTKNSEIGRQLLLPCPSFPIWLIYEEVRYSAIVPRISAPHVAFISRRPCRIY